ncbi:hypothetical protein G6F22_016279 [Rhizopus arrhizus]|nr:hypothetical protein G6F22_016279 [Rhizopus arrhizus]
MARLVHGNRRLSGRNTVPVVMGQASDGRGRRQGHRDTRLAAGDRAADPDTGAGEPAGRLARLAVSDRVALLASDRPSSPNSVRRVYGSRRAQRGVYALEFGLVFVVFFLVFYAILTYSLVAAAQQSVTLAALDGARKFHVRRRRPGCGLRKFWCAQ